MPAALLAGIEADRPRMNRDRLDVENHHAVPRQMIDRREQRVIIQVLVVDHVVLQFVDHLAEIVHLEGEHAVRMQRFSHRPRCPLDVGDMSIDVVGHDQVDLAVLGHHASGNFFGEIVVDHLDAGIVDGGDHVGGRVDADHGADALIGQRTQQHAVIAAEFEHGGAARLEETPRHFRGVLLEVIAQRADRG